MKNNSNAFVAIATIKFKVPEGWETRTLTFRKGFVYTKRKDAVIKRETSKTAEYFKQKLYEQNGLELSYTIKIETIGLMELCLMDEKGNVM